MTAADLAAVVAARQPPRPGRADTGRIHPATRTFQALRIAVNRELEVLGAGLAGRSPLCDRAAAWRSSATTRCEDRIVKRFIARESRDCVEDPLPPVCTCGHRAQLQPIAQARHHADRRRDRSQPPRTQRPAARGRKARAAASQATKQRRHRMSRGRPRHQASRRRMYSSRQRELRERRTSVVEEEQLLAERPRRRHRDRGGTRLRVTDLVGRSPSRPRQRSLTYRRWPSLEPARSPASASSAAPGRRARPRPRPAQSPRPARLRPRRECAALGLPGRRSPPRGARALLPRPSRATWPRPATRSTACRARSASSAASSSS